MKCWALICSDDFAHTGDFYPQKVILYFTEEEAKEAKLARIEDDKEYQPEFSIRYRILPVNTMHLKEKK